MSPSQLSYAVLHGPIHHPDTGQFGPVLSNKSDGIRSGLKMTQLDGEVMIEVPNKKVPKKTLKFLVDNSGFTHRVLAASEENS